MRQAIQPLPYGHGSEGVTGPRPSAIGPEVMSRFLHKCRFFKVAAASWFLLASAGASLAAAPPKFLLITQIEVRPGRGPELSQLEAARSNALAIAKWPTVSIAMKSVTGLTEIWYLTGYDSLEKYDRDQEAVQHNPGLKTEMDQFETRERDLVLSKRDILLVYHDDISYRPDFDWAQFRCLDAIRIHLRQGHHAEYLENRKITVDAHKKGGIDEHLLVYTVVSGAPSASYLVLRALKSIHQIEVLNEQHDHGGEIFAAGEEARMISLFAASVESEEEEDFCADPSMSYVTKSWAKMNPDFWHGF